VIVFADEFNFRLDGWSQNSDFTRFQHAIASTAEVVLRAHNGEANDKVLRAFWCVSDFCLSGNSAVDDSVSGGFNNFDSPRIGLFWTQTTEADG